MKLFLSVVSSWFVGEPHAKGDWTCFLVGWITSQSWTWDEEEEIGQTGHTGHTGQTGHTGKTGGIKQLNLTFQETCAGQISQFLRCLAMLCIFIPPFIFVVVLYRRDKMFGMQQRLGIIDCYWVAGLHTQVYVIKQLYNHAVSLSRTYMLCIPTSVAKVPAEKYCIEHAVLLL